MKRIISTVLFVMITVILSVVARAGYLEHYTEKDGLLSNQVNEICIAESGVKWFAAFSDGLSSFDELRWETYPAYGIWDMTLDNIGRPWVATSGGIGYLWKGIFQWLYYPLLSGYSAVIWSPDGALWTGGWVGELEVWRSFDPLSQRQWKCWKGLMPWKFATDGDGRVWFVGPASIGGQTQYGVWRISGDGESWDRIDDNLRLPTGIRYGNIYASPTGRVWVQGPKGENHTYTSLPPFYSDDYETWFTFDESPSGLSADCYLWMECSSEEGVWFSVFSSLHPGPIEDAFYYDSRDWRFIKLGAPLYTVAVDERTGDVWFGTNNGAYVLRGGPEAWPPVWAELEAVTHPDGAATRLSLLGSAEFQMDLRLDLYVAVELPEGTLLFAPDWSASMAPLARNLDVPIGLNIESLPLITLDTADLPAGTYRWYAALTHAGTTDFASNIASCDWQFE